MPLELTSPEHGMKARLPLHKKALEALRNTPLEHVVLYLVMIMSGFAVDEYPATATLLGVAGLLSAILSIAYPRIAWPALSLWYLAAVGTYFGYYSRHIDFFHLSGVLLAATALLWSSGVSYPTNIRKPSVQNWAVTIAVLSIFALLQTGAVLTHFTVIGIVSCLLVPVSFPFLVRYWRIDERRVLSPLGAARWVMNWGLFAWLFPIGVWRYHRNMADDLAWVYGLVAAHLFVACYATLVVESRERRYWWAGFSAVLTLIAELILVVTLVLSRVRGVTM